MKLFSKGDKVGIVACSNGLDKSNELKMNELGEALKELGLIPVFSDNLYKNYSVFNGSNKEKAEILMNLFIDNDIKGIFDVSGGDLANGILDHLNFETIRNNMKPFLGYSDLSVVINAIYSQTNMQTYLYQIRNLIDARREVQVEEFKNTFMDNGSKLLTFNYEWVQGSSMEGIVVGGNLRCLLKLAGTKYMPDFKDKIIFLESLGGDVPKMFTYLTQYKQLGVFEQVKGIILGEFSEMEREKYFPNILEITKEIVGNSNIPIVKTNEIGHSKSSKCIIIGGKIKL
ncbi:S66 family peptidase [Clostridium beijerinckii]|uniref:Putative murein peptide carboxypeptidase n=1 Tax=Clostridium beijerinckii TaxID=1520 RepID=A0A1S8RRI5_CLOBE|nr:S66 peptidase family protein [Clostridium beijerinckii]NRY63421.1 muramoyltetrapeptide carboxypeptidase LdcA involved in peptidoglycan recycling [Clostridium beijerinckii]OOM55821.1 putative murein peptide carboxypeptidase [Clostridium beijerinckii]